ncbi:integrase, catalytic region, zinc finger, CCHC-type containing protein [Tanacetum coccineum]
MERSRVVVKGTTFQGGDKELLGVQGDDGGDSQGVSDEDIDEEEAEQKGACYNYGIEGHFASECRKLKENKAFMGGAWNDSEDGYEHQNDATCLMAIDSNEEVESLKYNVSKLQDEALNFSKFKSSSIDLDDMLRYSQTSKAYIFLNKETMRIEEYLNVTFDESLPEPKSSPSVEDDRINEPIVQDLNGSSSLQVNVSDEGYHKSLK